MRGEKMIKIELYENGKCVAKDVYNVDWTFKELQDRARAFWDTHHWCDEEDKWILNDG